MTVDNKDLLLNNRTNIEDNRKSTNIDSIAVVRKDLPLKSRRKNLLGAKESMNVDHQAMNNNNTNCMED